jgi:hypothetical protein
MIMKQIDLIDIEDPAVGGGQQARLVHHFPDTERLSKIQRADYAIFGCAHRELNQPCGA